MNISNTDNNTCITLELLVEGVAVFVPVFWGVSGCLTVSSPLFDDVGVLVGVVEEVEVEVLVEVPDPLEILVVESVEVPLEAELEFDVDVDVDPEELWEVELEVFWDEVESELVVVEPLDVVVPELVEPLDVVVPEPELEVVVPLPLDDVAPLFDAPV